MSKDADRVAREEAEKFIASLDAHGIDVDDVGSTKKGDERARLVWEYQQDEKEYRERQKSSKGRRR